MFLYQYILLAGFTCLLFNKDSRFASAVFLSGWAVYLLFVIDDGSATYYAASATIEMCIAYALNKRFRVISWAGYSLMILNLYGLFVHYNDAGRVIYINTYMAIAIFQLLILIIRTNRNGIGRLHTKHFVVRAVNFDSRGSYDRMYKNKTKKGSNR